MDSIIEDICKYFKVLPSDIARKKYGKLKEYRYYELIARILSSSDGVANTFNEMSKKTIIDTLAKAFPGKKNSTQSWDTFLLECIQHKKCARCANIKPVSSFNKFREMQYQSYCIDCNKQYQKVDYLNNTEYHSDKNKKYKTENKDKVNMWAANRRASELHATPPWADFDEIAKIYRLCPDGYHVDHIIPLGGEKYGVLGLHVHTNLQYLTAHDNMVKGSSFDSESYIQTTEYVPPYITNVPHH